MPRTHNRRTAADCFVEAVMGLGCFGLAYLLLSAVGSI